MPKHVILLRGTSYAKSKKGDLLEVPNARAAVWIERKYARLATVDEIAQPRINFNNLDAFERAWLRLDEVED